MVHRYPTRFQIKRQKEAALHETVTYVKDLLLQASSQSCFHCNVVVLTTMFHHLYENPILLTGHANFRMVTWNKMNEIEQTLLSKLQSLPARLAENNKYDMQIRVHISNILDLMENIRTKYW